MFYITDVDVGILKASFAGVLTKIFKTNPFWFFESLRHLYFHPNSTTHTLPCTPHFPTLNDLDAFTASLFKWDPCTVLPPAAPSRPPLLEYAIAPSLVTPTFHPASSGSRWACWWAWRTRSSTTWWTISPRFFVGTSSSANAKTSKPPSKSNNAALKMTTSSAW